MRYFLKITLLAILLLWPALMNGRPAYFADTATYLKGGAFAVAFAEQKLRPAQHSLDDIRDANVNSVPASGTVAQQGVSIGEISGMRSALYSVAAYLLRGPGMSMFWLILLQSVVVAFLILALFQLCKVDRNPRVFLLGAGIATIATSAPWYVSFAMPDIFAGAGIMGIAILGAYYDKLTWVVRVLIVAIVAFAVTAHASHIPLIAVVSIVSVFGVCIIGCDRNFRQTMTITAVLVAPLVLGAVAIFSINIVGFGELTLTAKRYPFALARSIQDGPARWHLEEECVNYQYAVCEIYDEFPETIRSFLWGPEGIRYQATPDQMQRIRSEEAEVLLRTFRDYPVSVARNMIVNTIRQNWEMGLSNHLFHSKIIGNPQIGYALIDARSRTAPPMRFFEAIQYTVTFISLGLAFLLLLRRSGVSVRDKHLLSVVVAGIIANAAICGILSGVTDRYQGRVVWVLPVSMIAIALRVCVSQRAGANALRQVGAKP